MAIRLINYVNNQLSSPALYTAPFASRPTYGIYGRLFMSVDTKEIYQDLATSWSLLADAGAGSGTLQSVTTNGSTTTTGITILSNNLALTNATSNFYIKALTIGSILFCDDASGLVSQDNANFFWDNTNNRLGIGTNAPSSKLDIHSTGINATFNGTSTNNAYLVFQNAGTSKWYVGNLYSGAVANDFVIYDFLNSAYRLYVHNTGVINIPTSLIIGSATPTSAYAFDVTGTAKISSTLTLGTITAGSVLFSGASGLISQDNATFFWDTTNKRLGIGNVIPVYPLDVNGAFRATDIIAGGSTFSGDGTIRARIANNNTNILFLANGFSYINGGNFAIGTTTDGGYKLDVVGSIRSSADLVLSAGNPFIYGGTTTGSVGMSNVDGTTYVRTFGATHATSANKITFVNNGSTTLSVSASGVFTIGNLAGVGSRTVLADASGNLSAPVSDLSVKQNIKSIGYGLNEILKMNPVWFDFIDEYKNYGEGRQNGNIAQEMKEIIPEAVFTTPSTGKMGIEYSQLHAVYIKAIQELNEKLVRNNIN